MQLHRINQPLLHHLLKRFVLGGKCGGWCACLAAGRWTFHQGQNDSPMRRLSMNIKATPSAERRGRHGHIGKLRIAVDVPQGSFNPISININSLKTRSRPRHQRRSPMKQRLGFLCRGLWWLSLSTKLKNHCVEAQRPWHKQTQGSCGWAERSGAAQAFFKDPQDVKKLCPEGRGKHLITPFFYRIPMVLCCPGE